MWNREFVRPIIFSVYVLALRVQCTFSNDNKGFGFQTKNNKQNYLYDFNK